MRDETTTEIHSTTFIHPAYLIGMGDMVKIFVPPSPRSRKLKWVEVPFDDLAEFVGGVYRKEKIGRLCGLSGLEFLEKVALDSSGGEGR